MNIDYSVVDATRTDPVEVEFMRLAEEAKHRERLFLRKTVAADAIRPNHVIEMFPSSNVLFRAESRHGEHLLLRLNDGTYVRTASSQEREPLEWFVAASAVTASAFEAVRAAFAGIAEYVPPPGAILGRFWALGANGPFNVTRALSAPNWDAITPNYSRRTKTAFDKLIGTIKPTGSGQFVLLHGAPGTGKTYAIRALAKAWAPWADLHYVVDPDMFFERAAYLVNVALNQSDDGCGPTPSGESRQPRWKLIVAEDSDEFITIDAKQRSGQGMSRLLNLSEGLLGQGLNLIVLLTTNEELGKLHQAIIRPGRCLAKIAFEKLTSDEANAWRESSGLRREPVHGEGGATIAQLYDEAKRVTA